MIKDGETWHYLTVTKVSRLLRDITSNKSQRKLLFCLDSFRTEINKKSKISKKTFAKIKHFVKLCCLLKKQSIKISLKSKIDKVAL